MGIFKAYDIRGVYEKELTEKDAYLIAYYLVKFKNLKTFKVSHDGRNSYESLTKFFIKGLIDANCKIEYLAMTSTPNFYFSLFEGVNNGVMITASHNPAEYNGFKIMLDLVSFDSRNGLYDLEKLVLSDKDNLKLKFDEIKNNFKKINLKTFINDNLKDITIIDNVISKYKSFLKNIFDNNLTNEEINILKTKKIAIDFSSGVSSISGFEFFNNLNLDINFFNEKVDGNFPNHSPDPVKAKDYLKKNLKNNYFAAAFDGDGDRICFYDSKGNQILTDFVIAKYINFFNEKLNSTKFVCDLRVSKVIVDMVTQKNINIDFIRVGRAFYQSHMKEKNCKFGAELSGHLFFDEFKNLDNPDIALIYMLKIVAQNLLKDKNLDFNSIFKKFEVYYKFPETNLKVKSTALVLEKLEEKYKKNISSKIDGLSFNFDTFWFNIRASNTEPVIRINFEGNDKKLVEIEMKKLINLINNIK